MTEDFFDALARDIQESVIVKHPLLGKFAEGAFSRAQVKEFGLQYYHYSKNFYRFMAHLCGIVPDEPTREPRCPNATRG